MPTVLPEEALLVGDIFSTGMHCAVNAGVGAGVHPKLPSSAGPVVFPREALAAIDAGAGAGAGAGCSCASDASCGCSNDRSTSGEMPCERVACRGGGQQAPSSRKASPDVVAVVGCGPVGLLTVLSCVALGVPREQLLAVDSVPERLALAESFGATGVNFKTHDVRAVVDKLTDGRGVDAAMEAVGSGAALRLAYDLLRCGGVLSSVGVHTESQLPINGVDM